MVSSSVFTLATAVLDRFLAVVCPGCVWISQKYQMLTIIVIWALAFGISVPQLIYQFHADLNWVNGHEVICQSKFPSLLARRTYYIVYVSLLFLVPALLMLSLIVCVVMKTDKVRPNGIPSTTTFRYVQRKVSNCLHFTP